MILHRLHELAQCIPPVPTGFVETEVTKHIELRGDGSLRGVTSSEKKYLLPREQPQRTVAVIPRLIAENANYALALPREKDKPGQAEERHAAFVSLLQKCEEATGHLGVTAILRFLASTDDRTAAAAQLTAEDYVDFLVDGRRLLDDPKLQEFWADHIAPTTTGRCMVTGEEGLVVERMPIPIKGIPDGQVSGTALVSVNNPSGESHGLSAGFNSPIGATVAEGICNSLNFLLATEHHHFRVGKCVYATWLRDGGAPDISQSIFAPDPKNVSNLLRSVGLNQGAMRSRDKDGTQSAPHLGTASKVSARDPKEFFMLCLSANASRVVVREFLELTLAVAQTNIVRWFELTSLIGRDGSEPEPHSIYRLASSVYRESRDMPAHVPTAIVSSALRGTPLPHYLLGLAVKRNLAMQGPFAVFNGNRYISTERMALIKALLQQQSPENINLTYLQESHPDVAYHCGRLLALLESIQRRAAAPSKLNTTVVDRYYGAACASPASVCGNLLNEAQHHLAKIRKGGGDGWAQKQLASVLEHIPSFPKTLNLERQGLFALGFYHQKAADAKAAQEHNAAQAGEKE